MIDLIWYCNSIHFMINTKSGRAGSDLKEYWSPITGIRDTFFLSVYEQEIIFIV